jgi:hypothetical protein
LYDKRVYQACGFILETERSSMPTHKPKTLEDFPQFVVSAVRPGKSSYAGFTRFELDGEFDRIIHNFDPNWFWLLIGENDCLCTSLQTLDHETWTATLTCDVTDEPKVVGETLAYLSPHWQAYQVWMVLDPAWGWEKKRFQGADAIAEDYDTGEISLVGGREVRVWTKVELVGGREGASRHYPANDQSLPPNSERRQIPGGWGHEHCDLCKTHIEGGEFGYCDPGGRWICEKCYERYVVQRDLAFVDEL